MKPKDQGGLGLHAAKERNLTLAAKLCWRMKNEGEKPWQRYLGINITGERILAKRQSREPGLLSKRGSPCVRKE